MIRVPLAPTPGLITNETGFSVPNRCTDANLMRWRDSRPEPIGGWVKYMNDQVQGVCRNLLPWYDLDSRLTIAFGTNSHLYVYLGGTLTDITPAALPVGAIDGALVGSFGAGEYGDGFYGEGSITSAFPRTWSLATWGENLLANPRGRGIYAWDNDTALDAVVIPNAPTEVNTILVTPERQVLALGCREELSNVYNPLCIRGSDLENREVWNVAANNNAFEDILERGGTRLVGGDMVGPYVAAWTDQGLFAGQFIGDPAQTYQWDLQAVNCGLISPNAKVVVNKRAYWMTPSLEFYTWAPGEAPSPINCPISDDFRENVVRAQTDKIVAASIGQFGEVWWFYPDARDGSECSRYISFTKDVPAGSGVQWSKGILARTAAVDAGAVPNPLMVSPDGVTFSHEDGRTANGGALDGFYRIELPYLEEGGRSVMIKGMEPDFKDQAGALSFSFLMRKYPSDEGRAKGPYAIAPGMPRKHFLASGRSADMTISWNSSPAFHRMGKPVLLAEVTGQE